MRWFEESFTGREAVEWLHSYLQLSNKFGSSVSKEQVNHHCTYIVNIVLCVYCSHCVSSPLCMYADVVGVLFSLCVLSIVYADVVGVLFSLCVLSIVYVR